MQVGDYAVATGLKGFQSSTMTVRVTRVEQDHPDLVWCRTTGLVEYGVPLVLDRAQVTVTETASPNVGAYEPVVVPVYLHPTALVGFV